MTFDVAHARDVLATEWMENECPVCSRGMTLRDGCEPFGPCDHCARQMLDDSLDALEKANRDLAELRGRIVRALKSLNGDRP